MPASSERPLAFRDCGQNVFTGSDAVQAFTTGAATDNWYAGYTDYNFERNAPRSDNVMANSDEFT